MYNWSLYSTVVPQSIYWTYPWPEGEQKSFAHNFKKKKKKKSALHSSITLWFVAVAKNWKQKNLKKLIKLHAASIVNWW